MKVNELMIGDWVLYNETHQQILEISGIDDEVYLETDELVHQSEIQPIPLTPEILEKNGWMKVEVDGVFYPKQLKGELPWIGYATDGDNWRFRIEDFCEIKYIHQLQNALRLCEIEKTIEL